MIHLHSRRCKQDYCFYSKPKIRSNFLFILISLFSSSVFSEDYYPKDSFSYFAIGSETITYQETASIFPVKSDVTVNNLALMSGGFTRTTDRLAFSIEAFSTLYPNRADEEWNDTIGAFPLPLQQNNFTFSNSSTSLLGHYNILSNVRILIGGSYNLSTFKRFNFTTPYPDTVILSPGVVEETFGEFIGYTGLTADLALYDTYFNIRILGGMPLYSKIENSNSPNLTFEEGTGYDIDIAMSYSVPVSKHVNIGLIADYQYHFREKQVLITQSSQTEIPENVMTALRAGLFINWRF